MSGAEVVLVPEVFSLGRVQAGLQAFQRRVVQTRSVYVVGFSVDVGVFGAEFRQALFGTW
ncbi:hypothetical protein D3C87_1466840 [compost metagenome]